MTDCTDVCDIVMERLHYLGFDISDDESHDDILVALAEVEFTRISKDGDCGLKTDKAIFKQ